MILHYGRRFLVKNNISSNDASTVRGRTIDRHLNKVLIEVLVYLWNFKLFLCYRTSSKWALVLALKQSSFSSFDQWSRREKIRVVRNLECYSTISSFKNILLVFKYEILFWAICNLKNNNHLSFWVLSWYNFPVPLFFSLTQIYVHEPQLWFKSNGLTCRLIFSILENTISFLV